MNDIFEGDLTGKKFFHFVWPSVLMMLVIGLYYGIDSVFVKRLVGEDGLASLAIAYPVQGIMWGVAVMLASGASAIVAIKMGEGDQKEANEKYTMMCVVSIVLGLIFTALCLLFMDSIVDFLGATDLLRDHCRVFLQILVLGCPAAFLGQIFEYFIRVDGRPTFTLLLYISGGVVHLICDYIFMGPMDMGLAGAGYANLAGLVTVMLAGGAYFLFMDTKLSFVRFRADWKYIGHCFLNGSSELVSESSVGITTFFFNIVVLGLVGETGVAAVSIVLNIQFFMISVFLGFITGASPLISYFYGAGEFSKVDHVIKYSKRFIIAASVAGAIVCLLFGKYLVMIYEPEGSKLFDMSLVGIRYLSIAILLSGVNIYGSGFFTAYGNGVVSAVISASRGLVMVIAGMYLLSWLFDMTGVWLTLGFAEAATLIISAVMFRKYKDVYHYHILGA